MKNIRHISNFKRKINVRGASWSIVTKHALRDVDGTPCLGLCNSQTKQVLIEQDLPSALFLEVLLHEYIHACWYEAGVDDADVHQDTEHFLINAVCKDMVLSADFWAKAFKLG